MYERFVIVFKRHHKNLKEIRTVINLFEISGMKTEEKDILLREIKKNIIILYEYW